MALYQYNGIPIQSIQSITNQEPIMRPQTHKQKEIQRNQKQQRWRYQCHVEIGNYENTRIINTSINEVDFESEDQPPTVETYFLSIQY